MNIVYFGYDLFEECLKALIENPVCNVIAVKSFKTDNVFEFNGGVRKLAENNGIPFDENKITTEEMKRLFENTRCDLAVSAGYLYRIPLVGEGKYKGINVHPALLPEGRGPWPMPYFILNKLKQSGITIHRLSEKFDEGDILIQKAFNVDDNETLETLTRKLQVTAPPLLTECILNLDRLILEGRPQKGGSYWPEPGEEKRTVTGNMKCEDIQRTVRAFGNFGTVFISNSGEKITAVSAKTEIKAHNFNKGEIISRIKNEVVAAAFDGLVFFELMQTDKSSYDKGKNK